MLLGIRHATHFHPSSIELKWHPVTRRGMSAWPETEEFVPRADLAGGFLRRSTQPTLNLLFLLLRAVVRVSIRPEDKSPCSDLGSSASSQ